LALTTNEVEPYFTGYEAQMAVDCSDTEYPRWLPVWSATSAFLDQRALMGPPNWWWAAPCANWPASPKRYVGPWTAKTASPVLLVGNLFDPVTAYENAVAVTRLLPGSRLVTFAGWGHCAFDKSQCVREHVGRFLVDGTLPPKGTVCPAGPNPFLPQPALRMGPGGVGEALPPIVRPPPWLLRPPHR
jgi:pimeloyl-ACP methyl ester carboxylesterase